MCESKTTKVCKVCGIEKDAKDGFYKGIGLICYECIRSKQKKRKQDLYKNPEYRERELARQRELRKNPKYRERDRERQRERSKNPEYRDRKRERDRERSKNPEYRDRKRERERERQRELRKTHEYRERKRGYNKQVGGSHHGRAAKRGNHAERFKRIDVFKRDKFKCYHCGKKLKLDQCELDHLIPIAKGGSHTPENSVTSCAPCNGQKSAKLLPGTQISIFDNVRID